MWQHITLIAIIMSFSLLSPSYAQEVEEEQDGAAGPFELFLSIIVGGSVIAGSYEWIRQYLTRRREEYVNMANKKMDVIDKTARRI